MFVHSSFLPIHHVLCFLPVRMLVLAVVYLCIYSYDGASFIVDKSSNAENQHHTQWVELTVGGRWRWLFCLLHYHSVSGCGGGPRQAKDKQSEEHIAYNKLRAIS
jgi:hypothetical protein